MTLIDDELQRAREAYRGSHQATIELLMKITELEEAKRSGAKRAKPPALETPAHVDMPKTERRAIVGELRAKGRRLEGYAATFGVEARIGNSTETIAPGAFYDTLTVREDILALVDHDPGRVLARTRSGTLRLKEDSRGLAFDLDVPETTVGHDVLALAERGDLGGASFAFTVRRESWEGEKRTLESVDLHEISIVQSWPAYSGTVVNARARLDLSSDLLSRDNKLTLPPRVALARRYLESL